MQKIPGRFMRESFRKLASALLPGRDLKMLTLTSPPRSGPRHAKAFTCHELLKGGSYHGLCLICFRQAYTHLHLHYLQESGIFLNKTVSKSLSGWLTVQQFFIVYLLLLAVLGLCCCVQALSSCSERGPLPVAGHRFPVVVASPVVNHGL